MVLVTGNAILDAAVKGGWAVPALNINDQMQLQAYLRAGFDLKSPLFLQGSPGSRKFNGWSATGDPDSDLGARITIDLIKALNKQYASVYGYDIPIAVILDHGPNFEQCKGAIEAGFTMVMIDGSLNYAVTNPDKTHPANSLEENIKITKKVVDYAHSQGIAVEAEVGCLGGIEDDTVAKEKLTDVEEARRHAKETNTDSMAVAIGTSHGAYKFQKEPKLALDLVPKIFEATGKPLVMHGSSSVPPDLVAIINGYPAIHITPDKKIELTGYFINGNGEMAYEKRSYDLTSQDDMVRYGRDMQVFSCLKKSMGVPMDQIQVAIKNGHVAKVNIDTDGRLAFTAKTREVLATMQKSFDQRDYLAAGRKALYDLACEKIIGFGSKGKANDVEILTPIENARRYLKTA